VEELDELVGREVQLAMGRGAADFGDGRRVGVRAHAHTHVVALDVTRLPSGRRSAMRTTLDIDDRLLDALMARSPGLSKTKAIERAIDHYVKADAYERVRALRGAFPDLGDTTDDLDRLDLARQERLEQQRLRTS
jgi:hypothetical protein